MVPNSSPSIRLGFRFKEPVIERVVGPSLGEVCRRMVSISDAKNLSWRACRVRVAELCSEDWPVSCVLLLVLDVRLLEPELRGVVGAILVGVYFECIYGLVDAREKWRECRIKQLSRIKKNEGIRRVYRHRAHCEISRSTKNEAR